MLKVPAPFPQVGSYALLVDTNLPLAQQRAELVRIMRHASDRGGAAEQVSVAFPLRLGACGNRIVERRELIDGTPLGRDEERELTDLQRHLFGRPCDTVGADGRTIKGRLTPKMRGQKARADALRHRQIYAVLLAAELQKLDSADARETRRGGGSVGSMLPRSVAA